MTTVSRAGKLAFTARVWGDGAVICRAEEGRPGPVIDQEFGYFETWTRANTFANELNQGLELDPAEVHEIITDSSIRTTDLLQAAAAVMPGGRQEAEIAAKPLRIQFLLAQLDLAITFCRMIRNNPGPHARRMIRNARNAAFDAMHFVFRPDCSNHDAEIIGHRMERLLHLLQTITPEHAESTLGLAKSSSSLEL